MNRSAFAGLVALALSTSACHTPTPNDLIQLDLPGAARFALSTEDGIVALAGDDLSGKVPAVQYWKGREIRDDLQVVQHFGDLTLLRPETAKFTLSTFAAQDIEPGDDLYIQLIHDQDFERLPYVVEGHWYLDGAAGDLFALDDGDLECDAIAGRFAGAGVYVKRKGVYEIVGIVNGTLATIDDPDSWILHRQMKLLPFIRLDQIAGVLPRSSNFFERGPRAFRPDFEHGLDRDGSENKTANPKMSGGIIDQVGGKHKAAPTLPDEAAKAEPKSEPKKEPKKDPPIEPKGTPPSAPPTAPPTPPAGEPKKDGNGLFAARVRDRQR